MTQLCGWCLTNQCDRRTSNHSPDCPCTDRRHNEGEVAVLVPNMRSDFRENVGTNKDDSRGCANTNSGALPTIKESTRCPYWTTGLSPATLCLSGRW